MKGGASLSSYQTFPFYFNILEKFQNQLPEFIIIIIVRNVDSPSLPFLGVYNTPPVNRPDTTTTLDPVCVCVITK